MQGGVHSAADAAALIASATQLCEEVVPTMAWEDVAPAVHQTLQQFTA
jgi:DNA-binding transcriptional regulator YdaS (Cro superfamily)